MREIHTEIVIDRPPADVWRVLADFERFPEWNPFVREISGEARVGEKLRVVLQPPGGRAMTFTPTVLRADPERELRWIGHVLFSGIFDGEHSFTLAPVGSGTHFTQAERFGGVLVPLFGGVLKSAERGFVAMNQALKKRVEAS